MDHATSTVLLLATHFATSLFPLTVRLIPVITQIGRLIVRFRKSELTPQCCHQFETELLDQLRELGRIIVEWTVNHIEPRDRQHAQPDVLPGNLGRCRSKTPNRSVATPFGTITLCAISTNQSTASSRRSFPWRCVWDWKPAWPRRR